MFIDEDLILTIAITVKTENPFDGSIFAQEIPSISIHHKSHARDAFKESHDVVT